MSKDLDEFVPEVLIYAPSAPEPLVLKVVRDAAREFCEKTRIWHEYVDTTVDAPDFEAIVGPSGSSIHEFVEATLDGSPLEPITRADLDAKYIDWGTDTTEGTARYITQLQPNTVTIYPRQDGALSTRCILVPARTATEVPDFLVDDFATQIGMGAAGRLLSLPKTEYADPVLATDLKRDFMAFCDEQKTKQAKGQQRARQRTKPQFF